MLRLVALLLLMVPPPMAAQVVRELVVTDRATIRITNVAGTVRVRGISPRKVVVKATGTEGAGELFATGGAEAANVGVDRAATSSRAPVTLDITVPPAATLIISGEQTEVEISQCMGAVEVRTAGGGIRVDAPARAVDLESVDGNIEVAGAVPDVRVRTVGGTAVLRGIVGTIRAESVSGRLLVGGARLVRGEFTTISGEVAVKADLFVGASLDVRTHSGPVELRLPPTVSAVLDVRAGGGLTADFPAVRALPAGGTGRFTLGAGASRIRVQTMRGAVTLVEQPLP